MNELSSAETASSAVHRILAAMTARDLTLPTPCADFTVAELVEHLLGTIVLVGASAGVVSAADPGGDPATRITDTVEAVLDGWRRRGTGGEVAFAGRTLPAAAALGVLSIELVVHGWDFASALGASLDITDEHALFVLELAGRIITAESRRTAGFAAPVPVREAAPALDRLVAFTGRDPDKPFAR